MVITQLPERSLRLPEVQQLVQPGSGGYPQDVQLGSGWPDAGEAFSAI